MKDQVALGQTYGLAPFDPAARAVRQSTWEHELSEADLKVVELIARSVADLKERSAARRCFCETVCAATAMSSAAHVAIYWSWGLDEVSVGKLFESQAYVPSAADH